VRDALVERHRRAEDGEHPLRHAVRGARVACVGDHLLGLLGKIAKEDRAEQAVEGLPVHVRRGRAEGHEALHDDELLGALPPKARERLAEPGGAVVDEAAQLVLDLVRNALLLALGDLGDEVGEVLRGGEALAAPLEEGTQRVDLVESDSLLHHLLHDTPAVEQRVGGQGALLLVGVCGEPVGDDLLDVVVLLRLLDVLGLVVRVLLGVLRAGAA